MSADRACSLPPTAPRAARGLERWVRTKPQVDETNAFYFEGLRQNRFLIQRCTACERRRFPPMPSCPYCAANAAVVEQVSGGATLYSWIVVQRAFDPGFADQVHELRDGHLGEYRPEHVLIPTSSLGELA